MAARNYSRLRRARVIGTVVCASLLSASPAAAASLSGTATPSSTVYGNPAGNSNFEEVQPPVGNWTTTSTTSVEGRRASYLVPAISTCAAATITSLRVTLANTEAVYGSPVTEDLLGPYMHVVDRTTQDTQTVSTVISGARMDGAIALSFPYIVDYVVRGVTNPLFTTTSTSLPGSIIFDINTNGMTATQYNNLAVTVTHDLLDGANGFGDSMTTSQPTVEVSYDDGEPCHPVTPVVATLPDTGADALGILYACAMLFTGALASLIMIARHRFQISL